MAKQTKPPNSIFLALKRILRLSGRYRSRFYTALLIDLVQAVLVVLVSHTFRRLFEAVTTGNQGNFFRWTIISLSIFIIGIPLSYLRTRALGSFSERTHYNIRQKVAEQIDHLPMGYLEERHSGDFLSLINTDLAKVKNLTGRDLVDFVGQITRGLFSLIYIITISWQLALVSLVLTPVIFTLLAMLSNPIIKRTNERQEEIASLNSLAQDGLNGLPVTKSFNLVRILDERFRQLNLRVVHKSLAIARMQSGVDIISGVVGFSPFLITFGFGGYLAVSGRMTFGSIFAFINLLNYVVNPLGNIPRLVASISEAVGSAQRIFQVLDHPLERSDGVVTQPTERPEPIIRIKDLSFAYQADTPVLKNVSMEIQPGEKIAIVGPSGSGKSTLLKLLLGFYPLDEGTIDLFGEELTRWQLPAARQQMAFVAQDTYLFPVSILENIACGKPGAGQDEIEKAARAANIQDYIQTLPEGYQTLVGERGARLSGGQRQRISLARAILIDAPILLLDEPTSALDSESEALVQEALERFMTERTSIVIAHRLSTIKNADRVLVLDEGRIVEQGTHEELLQRGGLYQELYQKQFDLVPAGQAT